MEEGEGGVEHKSPAPPEVPREREGEPVGTAGQLVPAFQLASSPFHCWLLELTDVEPLLRVREQVRLYPGEIRRWPTERRGASCRSLERILPRMHISTDNTEYLVSRNVAFVTRSRLLRSVIAGESPVLYTFAVFC